jgi:hypothetical protein
VRFLFTTLQYIESDFYGRVGRELERLGHEVVHATYSRRAAKVLRRHGSQAHSLPELMFTPELSDPRLEGEAARIVDHYGLPTLRDVYRADWACDGRPEGWCVRRTVEHFLALERLFARAEPDVVVPEVGAETMRTAAHLIGLARRVPVLFLFYTIFPRSLRLYVDNMQAPIVAPEEIRELTPSERAEVEGFITDFKARGEPIRAYRKSLLRPAGGRAFLRHVAVRSLSERDNDYLRPGRWLAEQVRERVRVPLARPLYRSLDPGRPYVYFPLHVVDDYKIKRLLPHCVDQVALIEQVASSLPHGYDLVTKEHPMSIGRNPLSLLRRLSRLENVRLVPPHTSSHELIRGAAGVAVIGSTVGLEALLYERPVLTLGEPFYAGMGLTLDVAAPRELRRAVPELLGFRPDRERILRFLHAAMRRCHAGAPVLVDRSEGNAVTLARSLHEWAAGWTGPSESAGDRHPAREDVPA